MHPTANSVAFMRETPAIQRFGAAGDAGRWALDLKSCMSLTTLKEETMKHCARLVKPDDEDQQGSLF